MITTVKPHKSTALYALALQAILLCRLAMLRTEHFFHITVYSNAPVLLHHPSLQTANAELVLSFLGWSWHDVRIREHCGRLHPSASESMHRMRFCTRAILALQPMVMIAGACHIHYCQ